MPDKAPLTCPAWGHSHLLAVFVCQTCGGRAMCYSCAEAHQDQAHEVVGGVRGIWTELPPPQDEKDRLFNKGAEFALHLDRLSARAARRFSRARFGHLRCAPQHRNPVICQLRGEDIGQSVTAHLIGECFGRNPTCVKWGELVLKCGLFPIPGTQRGLPRR